LIRDSSRISRMDNAISRRKSMRKKTEKKIILLKRLRKKSKTEKLKKKS